MIRSGRPRNSNGTVYQRGRSAFWWVRYRDRDGRIRKESTGVTDRQEAERFLRDRLDARDEGQLPVVLASKSLTFDGWVDWFLEKRSRPPFRAEKTHIENLNALKFLRPAFGTLRLAEITPEAIEDYIEDRLSMGRRIHTKFGLQHRGKLKPATVHQEFRILRRIFSVAVKQKRLSVNPCTMVEFPVSVAKTTRKPHYVPASEQERIEYFAPSYLRHTIVIILEMGLRPYKELMPMQKSQVDLENRLVHIPDSKTPSGEGDMPMTDLAWQAFKEQVEESANSEYLFPSLKPKAKKPYITNLKRSWAKTLQRAGVKHFSLYELRHTFATRLSAGGVADHFVTQMLRQGDAVVFKRYSQAKLNMMREALLRLDRKANEHAESFGTAKANSATFGTVLVHQR
jgi:integrase